MARQLRDAQCHTIWEGTENICCIDVRRAIRAEGADRALVARVERALENAVPHKPLAAATDAVATSLSDVRTAVDHVVSAPEDMALLKVRRLAELLADVSEGALLLEEGAWSLERDDDGRKATMARLFAQKHLEVRPVRGITDPDRTVLDSFEPLVRYGRIDPAAA